MIAAHALYFSTFLRTTAKAVLFAFDHAHIASRLMHSFSVSVKMLTTFSGKLLCRMRTKVLWIVTYCRRLFRCRDSRNQIQKMAPQLRMLRMLTDGQRQDQRFGVFGQWVLCHSIIFSSPESSIRKLKSIILGSSRAQHATDMCESLVSHVVPQANVITL